MTKPFELSQADLGAHLEAMVDATFGDLTSQFLTLPKGNGMIEFPDFQEAYEVLKRTTAAFQDFTEQSVWDAVRGDALTLVVLRTILGLSPPEWADLATSETGTNVSTNAARTLDTRVRQNRAMFARPNGTITYQRTQALVKVAVNVLGVGAPDLTVDTIHRLDKFDTKHGLVSLAHAADRHVPYAVLLYERYLGRPFASHRDSVSELIGDVMESAFLSAATLLEMTP